MKVLAISGSRNPDGQTARSTEAILSGVRDAGGETSHIFLPAMNIQHCRQCENDGWGICRGEGRCTIDDDLASLLDEIRGANTILFATPVYFGDLSETLRAFLDRVRRICMNSEGRIGIENKSTLGLCVAGGGGTGSYICAENLDKVLRTCGFDVSDVIPVRRQNLEMKLPILEQIGRGLVAR